MQTKSPETKAPKIEAKTPKKVSSIKEGKKFVLKDEDGRIYGSYDEKGPAQEAADGWNEYYHPLVG